MRLYLLKQSCPTPFQGRGIDVDITLDLMIHDIDVVLSIFDGNAVSDV